LVPERDWDFSLPEDCGGFWNLPSLLSKQHQVWAKPSLGGGGQQDNLFTFKLFKTIFTDCPIVYRIEEYIKNLIVLIFGTLFFFQF
jgi:hypothetical protein